MIGLINKTYAEKLSGSILILCSIILLSNCSPDYMKKVDRLFQKTHGYNNPGSAVLVIHHGQPVLTRTYGLANIEQKVAIRSSSNFRLASFTKQFTAMCIMILKERGKLDYSTTLERIFPSFPEYGKKITIKNLLQHTSGLIAYENLIPDTATIQVLDKDVLQMMMNVDSTYFQPGSAYRYSNSGYAVLAMIIEKVSGKSFAEFLKEEIFIPLDMQNTVAFENGISTVSHRAFGYSVEVDAFQFKDQSITSAVLGDGGIYSSLDDLYKWDQALYTEQLIPANTLHLAFTPALENYGFGWRIDQYKGRFRVHHTGSTSGFRTVIQRYPDDEFTVIILSNRTDLGVADIAEKLTDLYLIK